MTRYISAYSQMGLCLTLDPSSSSHHETAALPRPRRQGGRREDTWYWSMQDLTSLSQAHTQAHTDFECFTILCQGDVPGLQVQNKKGDCGSDLVWS